MKIGTAISRVNRPRAKSGPHMSSVTEIAGAQSQPDDDAQQGLGDGGKCQIDVRKARHDERRRRIGHCYNLISPRLTLTPSRAWIDFFARSFASISTV